MIDPTANRRLALSQQSYSTLVARIYSTKAGMLGTIRKVDEAAPRNEVPLAIVGTVLCKVTLENGPIQTGDEEDVGLQAAGREGRLSRIRDVLDPGIKGTDRNKMLGAVVGKALVPLPEGKGVIQALVILR